jgi:hypothetical protein
MNPKSPKIPSTKVMRFAADYLNESIFKNCTVTAKWIYAIADAYEQVERAEKEIKKRCRKMKGTK